MMTESVRYLEIFEALKKEILGGKYASSFSFPSAMALAKRFGTTRATVRRALDRLRNQGFIGSRQGAATYLTKVAKSRKIGLIVPGVAYSEFYPPFLSEVNRLANENGYTVLLGEVYSKNPQTRVKQVQELVGRFVAEGVAGILYQPIEFLANSDRINRNLLASLSSCKIPVVLIAADIVGSPGRSEYDIVGINDFEAGRRLALHLRESGVKKVAFLSNAYSNYSVQNRVVGVRSVFCGAQEMREQMIDPTDEKSVGKLFRGRGRPDAIICRSDVVASKIVITLRKLGKRVPEDMLLAGFNDVSYASMLELTSIRVPSDDIANLAFHQLLARMANPALKPRTLMLPAPLTIRKSTVRRKK